MRVSLDWNNELLAQGLRCYRSGDFFLAHEHWEDAWRPCRGPEKSFLQALIQIAAAFHHFGRGNRAGATSLLERALARLEHYPAEEYGVAVAELRESLRCWIEILVRGDDQPQLPFPRIR